MIAFAPDAVSGGIGSITGDSANVEEGESNPTTARAAAHSTTFMLFQRDRPIAERRLRRIDTGRRTVGRTDEAREVRAA